MIALEKDVLWPGVFHPPGRAPVRFTPERIRQLHSRARDMVAAGLPIPMAWEHQPDATPAQRAREHIAFLDDFKLASDGRVRVIVRPEDADDAKQLEKVRYVSPAIRTDFRDGTGRLWPGESIIHVAVTPRPVNANQDRFQRVGGIALSHYEGKTLYLSLGDLEMADENETQETTADETTDAGEPGGQDAKFKSAVEALASYGLVLSSDVTPETFWDHIITAVETKKAAEQGPPVEPDELEDATVPTGSGVSVSMSLEAAQNRIVKLERDNLIRRIDHLAASRRVPKTVTDKLKQQAQTVELSLTNAGTLAESSVLASVKAYEALPAGNSFAGSSQAKSGVRDDDDVDLSQASAVPLSERHKGTNKPPATKKEVDTALADWDKT